MIGRFLNRHGIAEEAGARARRHHSAWLTHALQTPANWPQIPTRRVSQGGFAAMMAREGGPDRAERWWAAAIDRAAALNPHDHPRIAR